MVSDQCKSKKPPGVRAVRVNGQGAAKFLDGLFETAVVEKDPTDSDTRNRERVMLAGAPRQGQRLLRMSLTHQPVGKPRLRGGVTRGQFKRAAVFCLSLGPLP